METTSKSQQGENIEVNLLPDNGSDANTQQLQSDSDDTTTVASRTSDETHIEFDVSGVDPADFDGPYYLFKWIIPLIQVATWTCVLVMPLISHATRYIWLWVIFGVQMTFLCYGGLQCFHAITAMKRVNKVCLQYSEVADAQDKQEEGESSDVDRASTAELETSESNFCSPATPLMSHVFIIPNYKEPESILEETLGFLATHSLASRYTVILACEDSEKDHESKAERLMEKFHSKFHRILFTTHILQEGLESRGKGSNESWATRHLSKEVEVHPEFYASALCTHITAPDDPEASTQRNHHHRCCDCCLQKFSSDQVMIHILDADAHVHNAYTQEVEANCRQLEEEYPMKDNDTPLPGSVTRSVFCPPGIMSRNTLDVPVITRMQDFAWSATAFNNLTCFTKLCFPLSNYSFTLRLARDFEFFDATNECITEDMHIFLKAFFKTNGGVRVRPIYIPINMLNLNTGGSWWDTCKARFVQAERHARAVSEFAYCLRQLIQNPWGRQKYMLTWKVFAAMVFPPVIPFFVALAAPFCQLLHWIQGTFSDPTMYALLQFTQLFGVVTIVIFCVQLYAFDAATRVANTHLYKRPNLTMKQTLLPLPLVALNLWIYVVPPFAVASFRTVLPQYMTKYDAFVVSKKVDA